MSTLYRPVKITAAEQADTLPADAIVVDDLGDRFTRPTGSTEWWGLANDGTRLEHAIDLGSDVTALVPIEAEAHTVERLRACDIHPTTLTRYATGYIEETP